jgi:hypothetical protein
MIWHNKIWIYNKKLSIYKSNWIVKDMTQTPTVKIQRKPITKFTAKSTFWISLSTVTKKWIWITQVATVILMRTKHNIKSTSLSNPSTND